MNEKIVKKNALNRRDFLITLGAGASLAIAGFFTFEATSGERNKKNEDHADKPMLSKHITRKIENDQLVLCCEKARCVMNKTGEKVTELLDGNRTLSDIGDKIADFYSIKHTESLDASIASFICQLGSQGFLASPFYITMYETY